MNNSKFKSRLNLINKNNIVVLLSFFITNWYWWLQKM